MTVAVEACVDSVDAALAAEQGGADRLELCDNLDVGGTTPNAALIAEVKRRVSIPVAMMVRPRGGSFVFTGRRGRLRCVATWTGCASIGADVVVIGVLTDGSDR